MIAQVQVDGVKTILGKSLSSVTGTVRSVHVYLDMFVLVRSFKIPARTVTPRTVDVTVLTSLFLSHFRSHFSVLMIPIGQIIPSRCQMVPPRRPARLRWVRALLNT